MDIDDFGDFDDFFANHLLILCFDWLRDFIYCAHRWRASDPN
jgi:hypothetical protein